jgi:hypothetical protein
MLLAVHQDVHQGVTDGARQPDRESADATRECASVFGLGEEMHVIVLDRKLNDPEIDVPGRSDGAAHGGENTCRAQALQRIYGAQRNMNRMSRHMRRARTMRDGTATSGRQLPARSAPAPAPHARRWQG